MLAVYQKTFKGFFPVQCTPSILMLTYVNNSKKLQKYKIIILMIFHCIVKNQNS